MWAVSVGWTCQTYVDSKFDMIEYCSKSDWADDNICAKTCDLHGVKTDPLCNVQGKLY